MDNKKLYVGNLPWSINNDALRDLFSQFGEVVEAVVITDRMSGRSKGFGFVTFATEEAAKQAETEMNGKDQEGRPLVVNVAKPREERSDRGPRRNNFGGGNRGGNFGRRNDYNNDNQGNY